MQDEPDGDALSQAVKDTLEGLKAGQAYTRNPESSTQNPKPETRNPKHLP